jgi:hypothetical protein
MNPPQLINWFIRIRPIRMISLLVCACASEAMAGFVFNPNLAIPDNSILGVANTQTISMPAGIITGAAQSPWPHRIECVRIRRQWVGCDFR